MTVIETKGLTKRYGRLTAVDGIDLSVSKGEVFGFLGPNGSGKTTTIGMLLGIIAPTDGSIRLFEEFDRGRLHEARARVGATLETPNFYPYLTGRENLQIVAKIKGADNAAIDRALGEVGLTTRSKDRFSKYSLGMKQRLAIAGAMLGDPDLVILDEPANGLDPAGMREIRDIIRALAASGRTIFVSSHLLHEVEQTCTHVAIIKNGRILMHGSLAELTTGGAAALVRAPDDTALLSAANAYPGGRGARVTADGVIVELSDPDLSELNRYLAEHNVFASFLTPQRQSLEDVFMELTSDGTTEVAA